MGYFQDNNRAGLRRHQNGKSKKQFGELRIQSGIHKGVKLQSPASSKTHPMGAREKLALFNMLMPYLLHAKVLDLYAGSGALGLEALSLGALKVEFVENDAKATAIIKNNVTTIKKHFQKEMTDDNNLLDSSMNILVHQVKVSHYLKNTPQASFDLIIADPPYDAFEEVTLAKIAALLQKDGILALSYPIRRLQSTPEIPGCILLKSKQYAAAGIAIYRKI